MTTPAESRRRLFAAPLEEFVAVRDGLARELKSAGQAAEAEAIRKLRKPSVALWIANQLARLSPADVNALIDATARLRHGQSAAAQGASGDELREAMRAQREALSRLADVAGKAALEAKTKLTLELQRRVQGTVQAAAASEPEALREGRLENELQPAGFEGLLAAAPPHALPLKAKSKRDEQDTAAAERARKQEEAAARAREEERKRALHEAEREAQRLDAHARKLEEAATNSEAEAVRARHRADAARREADEAAARALALRS